MVLGNIIELRIGYIGVIKLYILISTPLLMVSQLVPIDGLASNISSYYSFS